MKKLSVLWNFRLTICLVAVAFTWGLTAQEQIDLTTAVQIDAGAQNFRVARVLLDWEGATIAVKLREASGGVFVEDGKIIEIYWEGSEATTLMIQLNKVDLSVKSLHKRIIEQAQTDGKLGTGTISGTPQ